MANIGYLLGRLPPLTRDAARLPIGPEEFSDLILEKRLAVWAAGVLDWLRIANWHSVRRKRPPPYPDASSTPMLAWPDEAWAAYYGFFSAISAPALLREWTLEDGVAMSARAAAGGRAMGLPAGRSLNRRLEGLIQPATTSLANAAARDARIMQFCFDWLDERVFSAGPDSAERIYAYAIKLLLLARGGARCEHSDAA